MSEDGRLLHQYREQGSEAAFARLAARRLNFVNDALAALGAKDREAVLLRFADGLSFPELGIALGTSEDAARMRLNRALDHLRRFFAKHRNASPGPRPLSCAKEH